MMTRTMRIVAYWGYVPVMEKKKDTTIVYSGYEGIMEHNMESTVVVWAISRRGPLIRELPI